MPKLDRNLRRRGTEFPNYFLSMPLCCPSRATLLSGRYAHNHSVRSNNADIGGFAHFDQRRALNVWLHRAGYRTGFIGKYMNGYGSTGARYVPPGWDEWHAPPGGNTFRMFDYWLNDDGRLHLRGSASRDYQTDVYRRLARRFIERERARRGPFFLFVNPLAPHDEADEIQPPGCHGPRPAPRDADRLRHLPVAKGPSYDEGDVSDKPPWIRRLPPLGDEREAEIRCSFRRSRRSLLAVDDLVGSVIRRLDRTHQLRRTFVFYTSDNGFMEGQHRIPKGKSVPYLETVRVPMIVRGPGVRRGAISEQVAGNIDLASTILDLADARGQVSEALDGISLERYLRSADTRRRFILLELFDRRFNQPYRGLQGDRYTWVRYPEHRLKPRELYDLNADPHQLENRADDPAYADIRAQLNQILRRLRDCRGRDCRGWA
jgi:arylsulfatase A-like enzyme